MYQIFQRCCLKFLMKMELSIELYNGKKPVAKPSVVMT